MVKMQEGERRKKKTHKHNGGNNNLSFSYDVRPEYELVLEPFLVNNYRTRVFSLLSDACSCGHPFSPRFHSRSILRALLFLNIINNPDDRPAAAVLLTLPDCVRETLLLEQ